jgi:hypothetical protein
MKYLKINQMTPLTRRLYEKDPEYKKLIDKRNESNFLAHQAKENLRQINQELAREAQIRKAQKLYLKDLRKLYKKEKKKLRKLNPGITGPQIDAYLEQQEKLYREQQKAASFGETSAIIPNESN